MHESMAVAEGVSASEAEAVRDRLEAFVDAVVQELPHPRQRANAPLYVRGLLEHGKRKSLEPMLGRLGASGATYQSVQQFVADSPWDPELVLRACAERVAPLLDVQAWIVDDTGFPKQGSHSPGVKRQFSGTLGTTANCQIGVSLHVVGERGTLPLGWALYLPQEWCDDYTRRQQAKIPPRVMFQSKPRLAAELIERAARWCVPRAPVLADHAYGRDTIFRDRIDTAGFAYVAAIDDATHVYPPQTVFAVPPRRPGAGRPATVLRPDQAPQSVRALAAALPADAWCRVERTTLGGEQRASDVAAVRVIVEARVLRLGAAPRTEWLLVERRPERTDYWLSNLPAGTSIDELVRLAHLRWSIELDYQQLKDELGLDHYEGRSWIGWHHHTALVSVAHAFLTEERRLRPSPRRPA
jgi:SRSO17 transposase